METDRRAAHVPGVKALGALVHTELQDHLAGIFAAPLQRVSRKPTERMTYRARISRRVPGVAAFLGVLKGAIPASLLAPLAQGLLELAERWLMPKEASPTNSPAVSPS